MHTEMKYSVVIALGRAYCFVEEGNHVVLFQRRRSVVGLCDGRRIWLIDFGKNDVLRKSRT